MRIRGLKEESEVKDRYLSCSDVWSPDIHATCIKAEKEGKLGDRVERLFVIKVVCWTYHFG